MTYNLILPAKKMRGFCEKAAAEYRKRLLPYCDVQTLAARTDRLQRETWVHISPGGQNLSSEEFADKLLCFGACTSFFLNDPEGAVFNETITLTSPALPWDLQAVLLLEQIYRAYRINMHQPYHK